MGCKQAQVGELYQYLNHVKWISPSEYADNNKIREFLNDEEYQDYIANKKSFDVIHDFDAYFPDFVRYYNINLLKDEISYFEFSWMIDALFTYEDSMIAKRASYRQYKASKGESPEYSKYMRTQREKYTFGEIKNSSLFESLKNNLG